jgi:hypothetical protein
MFDTELISSVINKDGTKGYAQRFKSKFIVDEYNLTTKVTTLGGTFDDNGIAINRG